MWKKKRLKLPKFPQDIADRYVLLLDPMLGMCYVSIVFNSKWSLIMDSNGWIGDESCWSAHGSWSTWRAHHLYQLGTAITSSLRSFINYIALDCFAWGSENILRAISTSQSRKNCAYIMLFRSLLIFTNRLLAGLIRVSMRKHISFPVWVTLVKGGAHRAVLPCCTLLLIPDA